MEKEAGNGHGTMMLIQEIEQCGPVRFAATTRCTGARAAPARHRRAHRSWAWEQDRESFLGEVMIVGQYFGNAQRRSATIDRQSVRLYPLSGRAS